MSESKNELKVIKTAGQFDIIMLAKDEYAVRKRYKSFLFRKPKQTFMVMNRNGTDFTFDSIATDITISTLDRAEFVFNANVLKAGGI